MQVVIYSPDPKIKPITFEVRDGSRYIIKQHYEMSESCLPYALYMNLRAGEKYPKEVEEFIEKYGAKEIWTAYKEWVSLSAEYEHGMVKRCFAWNK